MPTPQIIYLLSGCALAALGLFGALAHAALLRRVMALNILGGGIFLLLIATAWNGPGAAADPVPHALVLTGIVVAVSATAFALALGRRLRATRDE